jgi:hypothetical protein
MGTAPSACAALPTSPEAGGPPGFPEQGGQAPLLQGKLHARLMQVPVRLPRQMFLLRAQFVVLGP